MKLNFLQICNFNLHDNYGDQMIQVKTNKLPKGLVTFENIFNPNDEFKG